MAVKVDEPPEHTAVGVAEKPVMVGCGFTVTDTVLVAVQPLLLVTKTVYVAVTVKGLKPNVLDVDVPIEIVGAGPVRDQV